MPRHFRLQDSACALLLLLSPLLAAAQTCPTLPAAVPLTLALAESRLATCNREVLAAQRAVEGAEADRVTAGQRPNPNLTVGASNINPHVGIGGGPLRDKTVDSSIRLDQLVERGGKAGLREQQADAAVAAARADLQEVVRQQRLLLRQNFFELQFQQSRAAVQREFLRYAGDSLAAAEKRLKVGDVALNEANRFRLDDARARNDLRQAEVDLRKARTDLARSIAAEPAAAELNVVPAPLPAADALAAARFDPGQRADLVAAARRIEAAEATRSLAASIATRDVTVSAQFDRWPASPTDLQGTGNSFGLYLSIPLSLRHANQGEVRRAAVDLQAARDALDKLRAQAAAEATLAIDGWRAAAERSLRIEQDMLPLAREVARGAEFAYAKGASGVFELLDARRVLKQTELDAAAAQAEAGKAWAQWAASTELMTEKQP
jgi:cobalt-zinc-cadmium efflux system outer membrane protein